MSNKEAQEFELFSMQSIYKESEFVVEGRNPPSGRIVAEVRLPEEFYVQLTNGQNFASSDANNSEIFQVAHLPPLILSFRFPQTYPLQTCPAFLLSCNWLTLEQLSVLCKELEALWKRSKDAILYTWTQFLQDKCLDFLEIGNCLNINDLLRLEPRLNFQDLSICDSKISGKTNEKILDHYRGIDSGQKWLSTSGGDGVIDSRAVNDLVFGNFLIELLKEYNSSKMEEVFGSSYQECNVCLLTKKGTEFIVFKDCNHFFCSNCVKDYFESQINEGNIHSLKCLGQCETLAEASLVKGLIGADLYEKYDKLLLSSALDSMSDISYCPRKDCQCACVIDTCGRMATCSACEFIFCPFCNMTFHGVAPCDFKTERKKRIFDEFMKGNAAKKKELEKIYGKRVVKSLVEDTLSESWKNSNSKNCPHCRTSIEKTDGCNKMTCYRCGSAFCWLCMKLLRSENPYSHYSDSSSECFNQLFPEELRWNDNFDGEPEEGFFQEDDVQPGEYLNLNPDVIEFQRGVYMDVDFGALLRELMHRELPVEPEENLNNE